MLITIQPADGHCGRNKRGIRELSLIQTSAQHNPPRNSDPLVTWRNRLIVTCCFLDIFKFI